MSRKKILCTAVELEQRGHQYYSEHAEKTDNPLARRVLKTLAAQELEHIAVIELLADGDVQRAEREISERGKDVQSEARKVFGCFERDHIAGWELEDRTVYERARQLEIMSVRLYSELADEAEDERERELLLELVEEERGHIESLDNVQYYLQNTEDWLAMDESRRWNWMV